MEIKISQNKMDTCWIPTLKQRIMGPLLVRLLSLENPSQTQYWSQDLGSEISELDGRLKGKHSTKYGEEYIFLYV